MGNHLPYNNITISKGEGQISIYEQYKYLCMTRNTRLNIK